MYPWGYLFLQQHSGPRYVRCFPFGNNYSTSSLLSFNKLWLDLFQLVRFCVFPHHTHNHLLESRFSVWIFLPLNLLTLSPPQITALRKLGSWTPKIPGVRVRSVLLQQFCCCLIQAPYMIVRESELVGGECITRRIYNSCGEIQLPHMNSDCRQIIIGSPLVYS